MKLQSLAIIFIIIILPISLLLESYTKSRIQTISIQSQYDSKLMNATYDAIKAYQINNFNNIEDGLTNSKIRDIKASINTFYNSISTNFASIGYSKSALQNYVPALVYTMYDGYYIYGPFRNTWDNQTANDHQDDKSFTRDELTYGLKPYVYYSCRYKKDENNDVIITYSLDNYIEVQGKINGVSLSKYGYVLGGTIDPNGTSYNGIPIKTEETLRQNIFVEDGVQELQYVKKDGTKYYKKNDGNIIYFLGSGKEIKQTNMTNNPSEFENHQAVNYYKSAYEMQNFIRDNLDWINTSLIYSDENGYDEGKNYDTDVGKVFDFTEDINADTSNYNTHRIDVIKYSINKNLALAISNYNHYYAIQSEFKMPKLKETDWAKITENIGMISFVQGLNIGGKIYNGYAIVNNNKNSDVVIDQSIYIMTADNVIHKITEKDLYTRNDIQEGIFNIDIERRSAQNSEGSTEYYYPIQTVLSYDSIVTLNKVDEQNMKENLDNNQTLATIYYTALGREKYSLYRQKVEF